MRKLTLLGLLFLSGCGGNITGPFQQREPQRVDDPRFPIAEQERRSRDRLAMPDESNNLAPNTRIIPPAGR